MLVRVTMRLKIILFAVFSLRAFSPSWARKRECHEIKIKYGTVAIEDSHLNFSCDKGYQLKGSETVPCQEGNIIAVPIGLGRILF